ncbi:hypothetical protein NIES4071_43740 [Calothrix sp. NIES-4071]|nr:hypothetical protein NIES4071_43740 [Calothrix sp. NIES-4071]BAZ58688.1 hypothetical protein NIES4105_43670 [Calothrix sp. NIES-4105]
MKLYYRGLSYEYNMNENQSQETIKPFQPVRRESEATYQLSYRGLNYNVNPNHKSTQSFLHQETYQLIYRGIAYLTNRIGQKQVTSFSQPVINFKTTFSTNRYSEFTP